MDKDNWRRSGGYDLDSEGEQLEVVELGYGKYRQPDAEDPEVKKARERKARQSFIAAIAAVTTVVIVLIVLSGRQSKQTDSQRLREITSLEEATYLFAEEDSTAVGTIRRSFGRNGDILPFNDGIVATYLFLEHPVEIWVGIAPLPASAVEAEILLLNETNPELNNPDDPNPRWRSQSQFVREGTTITQVAGREQRSYFYRDSNMIVWIRADSITATFALQAALNTNLRDWIASVRQGAP